MRDLPVKIIRMWQTSCFPATQRVGDARALASVIGEDELSPIDKNIWNSGREFEKRFIGQDIHDNRTIIDTLNIGWGF